MADTCIRFGEFGARVMIEDKKIQHYAMHVDADKKEVSCWIASEPDKVREFSSSLFLLHFVPPHKFRHFQLYG
jgi:hypothetical protein